MGSSASRKTDKPTSPLAKQSESTKIPDPTYIVCPRDVHYSHKWQCGEVRHIKHEKAWAKYDKVQFRSVTVNGKCTSWTNYGYSIIHFPPSNNKIYYVGTRDPVMFATLHSHTIKSQSLNLPFTVSRKIQSFYWYSKKHFKPHLIIITDHQISKYDIIDKTWKSSDDQSLLHIMNAMSQYSADIEYDGETDTDLLYLLSPSSICAYNLEDDFYSFYREIEPNSSPDSEIKALFVNKSTWNFILRSFDTHKSCAFVLVDEDCDHDGIERLPNSASIFYGIKKDQKWISVKRLNRIYVINYVPKHGYGRIYYLDLNDIERRKHYLDISLDVKKVSTMPHNVCLALSRFLVIFHLHFGDIYCIDIETEQVEKNEKVLPGISRVVGTVYDEQNQQILLFSRGSNVAKIVDIVEIIPLNMLKNDIVTGYIRIAESELLLPFPHELCKLVFMFCDL